MPAIDGNNKTNPSSPGIRLKQTQGWDKELSVLAGLLLLNANVLGWVRIPRGLDSWLPAAFSWLRVLRTARNGREACRLDAILSLSERLAITA